MPLYAEAAENLQVRHLQQSERLSVADEIGQMAHVVLQ